MIFPTSYNTKEIEEKWQRFWETKNIYAFDPESKKPIFSIDTPPPYVSSAHLHVGHAMSYSQAEFVIRFFRMNGYNIFYPMGFDDNGLPTERFVEKKYKINKGKIKRNEFVELCLKETKLGGETYKKLWKSLGLSVDWNLLYSTINPQCQRISQRSFIHLYKQGRITRHDEPMIWCPQCRTAIAQAEIETEEKSTELHTIVFKTHDGQDLKIATTRPELIPACVGLFVNENDERYKDLIGKEVSVPLMNHSVRVYADNEVSMEYGTGLMMVCTWGDAEDVHRWKEFKLDTRMILDEGGRFTEDAHFLQGLKIEDGRKKIVEILKEKNHLIESKTLTHQVGTHERCQNIVEYLSTPQWFIKILDLKEALLARGRELNWYPDYMRHQYEEWVENLKWDWCISRQRYYGVPFPVWYCNSCDEIILPDDSLLPIDPTLQMPHIKECPKCGKNEFRPESDVMDTWMTSSLTPLINAEWGDSKTRINKIYPMTVRVQAFEIIRTWLFYTLVKSHLHTNSLPWKDVMISGWGLDAHGKKMSKSKGNFVPPEEIIEKYGADALRYWAAGAHLGANLNYTEEEIKEGRKLCLKLWNASRFISEHISNVEESMPKKLQPSDEWILSRLTTVIETTTASFKKYDFARARNCLDRFFWLDLCDSYLEIVKARLYKPEVYGAHESNAGKYVCTIILKNILKLFAPFLPYITEELFDVFQFSKDENAKSIHVSAWPIAKDSWYNKNAEELGDMIVDIVKQVRKYKTSQSLALNTEIKTLSLSCNEDFKKNFERAFIDLTSATRAHSVVFTSDAALPCEKYPIKIGIKI